MRKEQGTRPQPADAFERIRMVESNGRYVRLLLCGAQDVSTPRLDVHPSDRLAYSMMMQDEPRRFIARPRLTKATTCLESVVADIDLAVDWHLHVLAQAKNDHSRR